jgi:hypothetical protein
MKNAQNSKNIGIFIFFSSNLYIYTGKNAESEHQGGAEFGTHNLAIFSLF